VLEEILTLDVFLLILVGITGIAVIQVRSLFSATILAGIYSLLMAVVWTNMHALDVAFTEAAVGAGISTVLLLGALVLVGRFSKKEKPIHVPGLIICGLTGTMLIYGTLDMPKFGDPDAPIHNLRVPGMIRQDIGKHHTAAPRVQQAKHDSHHAQDDYNGHVPNTVTTLLGAYRGYDTMYETTVIFVAGLSMLLLLRRRREDEPGVPKSSPDQRSKVPMDQEEARTRDAASVGPSRQGERS
jgi:multicomponent Na+:H+ antiporter subunit B